LKIIKRKAEPVGDWNYICGLSDVHLGSGNCDETAFLNDLNNARKLNARIIIVGDLFDALLPKDTKRFKISVLAKWLQDTDDVINVSINRAYEKLKNFGDLIDVISVGNHEESVLKYHSFDMISALIHRLNIYLEQKKSKHRVEHGQYLGYVQYKSDRISGGGVRILKVLYYHGAGGAAPVTKGMIDFNRIKTNFVFDLFLTGHKHNKIADSSGIMDISGNGNLLFYPQKLVQCGTYQKTYNLNDNVSFEEMKAFPPADVGCAFIKWRYCGRSSKKLEIKAEI